MSEEMKPSVPPMSVPKTEADVEVAQEETKQINAVSASVTSLVAFAIIHWKQVIAILLAAGLVIGFSLSGWKIGKIEKTAVDVRK